MREHGMSGTRVLGVFCFGAALGALAALLLSPRSGRETRALLARRGGEVARRAQKRREELARRTQELTADAQGRAGRWLERTRERFEEQKQNVKSAFEAGQEAMREEIRKGPTPPRG
jgi:gas vesicle protein